jgi:LysR family glycine cleavage system transcriptional activator
VHAERLAGEQLFPVCSPEIAREHGRHRGALPANVRLLRDLHEPWQDWFAATGRKLSPHLLGARYDDSGLLLQAAEAGHGIALARGVLAQEAIDQRRLVRLGTTEVPSRNAYHVVRAPATELTPAAQLFVEWLRAELQRPAGRDVQKGA